MRWSRAGRDRPSFPNHAAGVWGPVSADEGSCSGTGAPGGDIDRAHLDPGNRGGARDPERGSRATGRDHDAADARDDACRMGSRRLGASRSRSARGGSPSGIRRGRSCCCRDRGGRERDRSRCRSPLLCRRWPEQVRCSEVVTIRLKGSAASAPASVVQPLLVSDLPAFLRWRGPLPLAAPELEQLVDVVERLIVDSREWEIPSPAIGAADAVLTSRRLGHRVGAYRALAAGTRTCGRGRRGESPPRHRPAADGLLLSQARRAPPAQDRARERHRARGGARRGRRTAGAAGPSDDGSRRASSCPISSRSSAATRSTRRPSGASPRAEATEAAGAGCGRWSVTHATLDQHDAAVRTDDPVHRSEPESAAGEGAGVERSSLPEHDRVDRHRDEKQREVAQRVAEDAARTGG